MEIVKNENETELSMEELKDVVKKQNETIEQLKGIVQKMNIQNVFMRLDYLIKIMNISEKFESNFVDSVRSEIVNLMTIEEAKDEIQ